MRPEVLPGRPECPEPARWLARDSEATEHDVSMLIGAFVWALKPDYVIETGTYRGDTTVMIGQALQALGRGHLVSIDIDHQATLFTAERLNGQGLPVTLMTCKASSFLPTEPVDLIFIDCSLDDRFAQVQAFRPYASPRCVILMHDSALPASGPGVAQLYADAQKMVDFSLVYPWVKLPTPRGLAISRYR